MSKVCVVLGYGPGIGEAVARRFSLGGFKVALVSRTREKVEEAAGTIPNAKGFPADVTDTAALTATLGTVEAELGPIHALIYNAVLSHVLNALVPGGAHVCVLREEKGLRTGLDYRKSRSGQWRVEALRCHHH